MRLEAKNYLRSLFPAALLATTLALAAVLTSPLEADIFESFGSGANQFTMTFVPIGNPGNAADEPHKDGDMIPQGSVGYLFNMGKYEVSRDMISKANSAGNLGISLADMSSYGGNGVNRPATGVSWNEAARFVNWLNTSQGYSAAYKFYTQPGQAGYNSNEDIQLWLPSDNGYNSTNLYRNSEAHYFLPSLDEWYKAAYYDPNANGGAGGYWRFTTGSNTPPTAVSGGTAADTAVFLQPLTQGPADITDAGGLSAYGVMGMGGNVAELEETSKDLDQTNQYPNMSRGARVSTWDSLSAGFFSSHSIRKSVIPTFSGDSLGFRVASVPEPGSAAILMVVSAVGLIHRRARRS